MCVCVCVCACLNDQVAQKERKEAISKADIIQFQLYEEKLKSKKLEEQVRDIVQ